MEISLYQVDAFTDTAFAGNPAAVCVLPAARSADWMQDVAAEMNVSETAFLWPRQDGTYRLRWFTPTDEVALCGHATLASAHVLWSEGFLAPEVTAAFETESGSLTATRADDWIEMNFPVESARPVNPPPSLLDGLALSDPQFVGRSTHDYLLHCADEATVRALTPNMQALASLDCRGVIVTAARTTETDKQTDVDFVSRFFAPGVGVPEDPVTGSAHCTLGPYWANRTGSATLTGRQVSARGGTVRVHLPSPEAATEASADRLTLAGQAVTVVRGRLTP